MKYVSQIVASLYSGNRARDVVACPTCESPNAREILTRDATGTHRYAKQNCNACGARLVPAAALAAPLGPRRRPKRTRAT